MGRREVVEREHGEAWEPVYGILYPVKALR